MKRKRRSKRIVDEELLEKVRRSQCAVNGCRVWPVDPHHITTRGAGGGDTVENVMPLCFVHHAQWHKEGVGRMCEQHWHVKIWLEEHDRHDVLRRIKQ